MNNQKREKIKLINSKKDRYLKCISYCDILPKGIDTECEFLCIKEYNNYLNS